MTVRTAITIAAVDDDRMLLEGLATWLAGTADMRLIGTAATVDELLAGPGRDALIMLLDLRLKDGSDPAGNVRRLVERGRRVLVVSVFDIRELVVATFRAGASGYLTKDHDLSALVQAVREVAAGGFVLSPELAFCLCTDTGDDRPRLSARERALLAAYASGLTLQGAAHRLGIKAGTAKEYLDRIKAKYSAAGRPAHTKIELAERAREDGIAPWFG